MKSYGFPRGLPRGFFCAWYIDCYMSDTSIVIFTDGSSRGNPGPGGWGSIVVDGETVTELGGGDKHTTNNKMELLAAIEALAHVKGKSKPVIMYVDSSYVVNGITKWVKGWKRNNWITSTKTPVENRDLWERLDEVATPLSITWNRISGHAGLPGNERADEIATAFADDDIPNLYHGSLEKYSPDILNVSYDEEKQKARSATRERSRAKAFSYVSFVDGHFMRHTSWAECEKRVKGVKGARFKKAFSADDERAIAQAWGARNA